MIDKLRDKAGISREEAADALTRANWDMLEALVILEREGKIAPLTSSVVTAEGTQSRRSSGFDTDRIGTGKTGSGAVEKIKELLLKAVVYSLVVRRENKVVISLPVIIFILILVKIFRLTAAALLIGLFFGCRYSVEKRNEENGGNES
jgi:hypothetical protein